MYRRNIEPYIRDALADTPVSSSTEHVRPARRRSPWNWYRNCRFDTLPSTMRPSSPLRLRTRRVLSAVWGRGLLSMKSRRSRLCFLRLN